MSSEKTKKVILAIDDVSLNLATIKHLLSDRLDVRVAKSGELALFILGSVKVDLILLDIEMPGMSGFDFIGIMQDIPDIKDIPVIIVTSHAKTSILNKAFEAGAIDFIVKPYSTKTLREKVFTALGIPLPTGF